MRRRRLKSRSNSPQADFPFFKPKVQSKLKTGKPGDKYEVEADQMADRVVNQSGSRDVVQKSGSDEELQQNLLASKITPVGNELQKEELTSLQKMEEEEAVQAVEEEEIAQSQEEEEAVQAMEEEEEALQAKCDECENEEIQKTEEEETIQSKKQTGKPQSTGIADKLRKGVGGHKMDSETRAEMESGFGADFGKVNIHKDKEAAEMSQDLGAQAFTHGNDIYFNEGKYNPNTKKGKHLLAHELTHTIQQQGSVQKKVQKQTEDTEYTCSGKATRGVITPRLNISGSTNAPDGTRVSFYYLRGAGCELTHRTIASFGSTLVAGGKYRAVLQSMMTMIPPIGGTFIAVIGETNSYCCITVRPTR